MKLTPGFNDGEGIELAQESNSAFTTLTIDHIPFAGIQTLDIRLVGIAATDTIVAQYRQNSSADSDWVSIGQTVDAPLFTTTTKAGILTTNNGTTASVKVPPSNIST